MAIYSVHDIVKQPLSKYIFVNLSKDLDELKKNGGITKIQDFDKLMKYIMKSKTFISGKYNIDYIYKYTKFFTKILDLHPDNGLFSHEQLLYLFQNLCLDKEFLEKLIERNFILKYEYICIFLKTVFNSDINIDKNYKVHIIHILYRFISRINISDNEYNITEDLKIKSVYELLFSYEYSKMARYDSLSGCTLKIDRDYIQQILNKFKLYNVFFNFILTNISQINHCNIIDIPDEQHKLYEKYSLYHKLCILELYEILMNNDNEDKFKLNFNLLSDDDKTNLLCDVYKNCHIEIDDNDINDKYIDILNKYINRFDNSINYLQKLDFKIIVNNKFMHCKQWLLIINRFEKNVNFLTLNNLNETHKVLGKKGFIVLYKDEYNTQLLNKCIKINITKDVKDYLMNELQIQYDIDTYRYAIYTKDKNTVKFLLDNKYPACDKDLLFCPSDFKQILQNLFFERKILISDELLQNNYYMFKDLADDKFVNGDDKIYMNELRYKCENKFKEIFPFDTYHDNTQYSFYYDMAKNGELTLDRILNIHHLIGVNGFKHLIRLHMEFMTENKTENKLVENIIEKPKKNKKVIKRIIRKKIGDKIIENIEYIERD